MKEGDKNPKALERTEDEELGGISTRTKQSLAAQIHTRRDNKICRKDFFWCNRPMAIPWRRVPELRMCESKMTRRNVPDPNWETQVLRKVMWKIMKVKTVLSFLQKGSIFEKGLGPWIGDYKRRHLVPSSDWPK